MFLRIDMDMFRSVILFLVLEMGKFVFRFNSRSGRELVWLGCGVIKGLGKIG